jgi:parallel beta-helix repeat protein
MLPTRNWIFTPSRGNEVFGNEIWGNHYSGIFFADGSDRNNIFDNSVFGASNWAMESVRVQLDITLNNLTNLRSRNIGSGLQPLLLRIGAPVQDPPHSAHLQEPPQR